MYHHSFVRVQQPAQHMDRSRTSISSKDQPLFLHATTNPKNNGTHQPQTQGKSCNQPHSNTSSATRSSDSVESSDGKWAQKLLKECATAMSEKDSTKIHHLLWMLNELASPYGDCDQKLAAYFLQALFCKATDSGRRCYKTLISVAEKSHSFDSVRKLTLKFQEQYFVHPMANSSRSFSYEKRRNAVSKAHRRCRYRATPVERADEGGVGVQEDEAVAINCIGALRRVDVEERRAVIQMFQSLRPKVVTIVDEEADFSNSRDDFVKCFEECLRFYTIYFDMLDESFPPTSNEKLMLERECSRSIVRVLTCDDEIEYDHKGDSERRERGTQWTQRLRGSGFSPVGYSDDVVDDVKALLKRYRGGWSLVLPGEDDHSGIYLAWKEEPVVWASVWKP
ncbi:UNVERIFIED_CONTAM: protein SHORT-ROOT [Sesamum angustifolium]|uniref:Protein SHORT-ROOT n=1 Tax=Sesamum angustifolium TaxID=2727405 RepID=A0AAW2LW21_9LAMI